MKAYIDKTICKFLFLHDLSGWHYSARKSFREYWTQTPFRLTEEEQTALTAWRKLNSDFLKKKDDFILGDYLSGKLNKNSQKIILSVFEVFEPRFEFHYRRQLLNMRRIVTYLRKLKSGRYLKETYRLYGIKNRATRVYVAMSHNANKSAGGMRLGNLVILQFGDYKLGKDNSPILNTLFHELTHEGSVRSYLNPKSNIKLPNSFTEDPRDFVDEVIHKALWSEIGLFSQKQFGWSDAKVKRSYTSLLKGLQNPYREMMKEAFVVREYIAQKLREDSDFKFNRSSAREIVSVMRGKSKKT